MRALRNDPERCLAILNSPITTVGGSIRHNNAMRAAPWSDFKGAGKLPRRAWDQALWADSLEAGEFEQWLTEHGWDEDEVWEAVEEARRRFGCTAAADREEANGVGGDLIGSSDSD